MDRRRFLKMMGTAVATASGVPTLADEADYRLWVALLGTEGEECRAFGIGSTEAAELPADTAARQEERNAFIVDSSEFAALTALAEKIRRTRSIVGYGRFNLVGFDDMNRIGRDYSKVGPFTRDEQELFESLFYRNASDYGFYGEKVFTSVTQTINEKEMVKIDGTGHYLYRGSAEEMNEKIRRELGHSIVLTSGVRSVVKQMDLFLQKVISSGGDMSAAAHSLAPAGYSYHGVGDFDVGKVGFGQANFTDAFAETDEFKRLVASGYVRIRYTKDNPYGVRYEPWHVKVV